MKVIAKAVLFFVLVNLTSCSTQEDITTNIETNKTELISKTWKVNEIKTIDASADLTISTNIPIADTTIPATVDMEISSNKSDLELTFNNSSNVLKSEGTFEVSIKAQLPIVGNKEATIENNDNQDLNGNWDINNNTLTISNNSKSVEIEIIKLTENELQLSFPLEKSKNIYRNIESISTKEIQKIKVNSLSGKLLISATAK